MSEPRPCERLCRGECGRWKHYSHFRSWKRKDRAGRHGTESPIRFHQICKSCEQKARNEKKNADRARAIIEQRATVAAGKAGVSKKFFMVDMNYQSLIPQMRAHLSDEGLCQCCGHKFLNERDIQIEHGYPPRFPQDWALLHARNLGFVCGSCNNSKGAKPPLEWLDEQEERRLSNLQQPSLKTPVPPPPAEPAEQLRLF